MAYDESKDVRVKDLGTIDGTDIQCEIRSYDGGANRLRVFQMVGKNKDKIRKILRINVEEALMVAKFISDREEILSEFVNESEE